MTELLPIILFHGRYFFCHLGICNPICVKLLGYVRCHFEQFKKRWRLYLKPFSWGPHTRHTHTDIHTTIASIRRNAMLCILPINHCLFVSIKLFMSHPFHVMMMSDGAMSQPMVIHRIQILIKPSSHCIFRKFCLMRRDSKPPLYSILSLCSLNPDWFLNLWILIFEFWLMVWFLRPCV